MNMLILVVLLAGSCLATTPIQPQPQGYNIKTIKGRQFRDEVRNADGIVYGKYGFQDPQGGLRIVKYTAGKDGLSSQVDGAQGVPISSQPIVWNSNEPLYIEPAPLTYGSYGSVKGGDQFITERDQQRYLNIDESIDGRDEVNDEIKAVNEPKVEVDVKDDSKVDSQSKPVVNDQQPSLLTAGISPVNVQRQVLTGDDQIFPQVLFGQRRLVEPQPQQQYAVKGKSLVSQFRPIIGYGSPVIPRQQVVYQSVQQHTLPISVEEHRVSSQGVKRPIVEYQLKPVQQQVQPVSQIQQQVPREWLRKPSFQVHQSGVKGLQSPRSSYQYFIQPAIPSFGIDLVQRQPVQQPQSVPQVFSLTEQQVPSIFDQRKDVHDSAHVGHDLHVVQEQPKLDHKHVVKGPIVPAPVNEPKIVIHDTGRHVPVVGGHPISGYQIPQHIIYPQVRQQQQYVPYNIQSIPVSDIQQYYSQISQQPIQSYDQYVPYINQNQQSIISQPIHYSSQIEHPIQQSVQTLQVPVDDQPIHVGQGVQGVQQVRVQDELSINNRGQDLRVNPVSVDQRSQQRPTILINSGVKSAINV